MMNLRSTSVRVHLTRYNCVKTQDIHVGLNKGPGVNNSTHTSEWKREMLINQKVEHAHKSIYISICIGEQL